MGMRSVVVVPAVVVVVIVVVQLEEFHGHEVAVSQSARKSGLRSFYEYVGA